MERDRHMTRRRSNFTETDVKRAIRAARAAGVQSPVVEILPDGTIRVLEGEKPQPSLQPAPQDASIWQDCA
jgi:hypothetical protein